MTLKPFLLPNPLPPNPYTDWAEGALPEGVGPYQVLLGKSAYKDGDLLGYQYWNGEFWGAFAATPAFAEDLKDRRSTFQNPIWRGLSFNSEV